MLKKKWQLIIQYTSYMLNAVRNLDISYVACFDHALNTAVSRIFMDDIKDVVYKVKLIHNIFGHSWKTVPEMGKYSLQIKNVDVTKKLVGGQCWNSSFIIEKNLDSQVSYERIKIFPSRNQTLFC